MATRTQVAQAVAGRLQRDRQEAVREAAAWLVQTGREREAPYLARDIAAQLALQEGYLAAEVTVARPLTASARQETERFLREATAARVVELSEVVRPEVIGGVRIRTPNAVLDTTVQTKLETMARRLAGEEK